MLRSSAFSADAPTIDPRLSMLLADLGEMEGLIEACRRFWHDDGHDDAATELIGILAEAKGIGISDWVQIRERLGVKKGRIMCLVKSLRSHILEGKALEELVVRELTQTAAATIDLSVI